MFQNSNYSLFDSTGCRKYLNPCERDELASFAQDLPTERKAFCLFLLNTGVRITEALNLKSNQLDLKSNVVFVECLKKRKKGIFRSIPISTNLASHLKQVIENKGEGRLFDFTRRTGYRIIKDSLNAIGIEGVHACPKGLRHSFAIYCLVKDIPLTLIQKWMGHSSLTVTSIYLQVASNEEYEIARKLWE